MRVLFRRELEEDSVIPSHLLGQLKHKVENTFMKRSEAKAKACPTCETPMSDSENGYEHMRHNPETCRLVNLALSELGVTIPQVFRINIYPGAGPLRGFYFTGDPYTIHISEDAYAQMKEYIIFHETKHLVDCLRFGRSEEITPDRFARTLCLKYGYTYPPEDPVGPRFTYA